MGLSIQVGLESVDEHWVLLGGKLQEIPDRLLPKQLIILVPHQQLPTDGIGEPWISPLIDDHPPHLQ